MSHARGLATTASSFEARAGAQADFLHQIFRVRTPAREPQGGAIERRKVRLHEACERLLERIAHRRPIVLRA
jgi:hypothetical protein